jgi:predicted CoA-binding protein
MTQTYSDSYLRDILRNTKRVAAVGVSLNPVRPSHYVARYMKMKGYEVIPVNPVYAGQSAFGQTVLASLAEIEGPVDMIDIFRRPEHVPQVVDEALEHLEGLKVVWMQIGVVHEESAEKARAKGLEVVMDRCPKMEYQRLFGELRMAGMNTGIISSKLQL